jgi:hypothetical protein
MCTIQHSPAFRRLRKEGCKFETNLGYIMRPSGRNERRKKGRGKKDSYCQSILNKIGFEDTALW